MEFNGVRASYGYGDSVIFSSPSNQSLPFSFRLEFKCANNIVGYEAFILGLNIVYDLKIKMLKVCGNYDLTLHKIREQCLAKNPRLKLYENGVWNCIELFDAFSIESIPRNQNQKANSMSSSVTNLQLCPSLPLNIY